MSKNLWQVKAEKVVERIDLARARGDEAGLYKGLARLRHIVEHHPEVRKQALSDRPLLEIELELEDLKRLETVKEPTVDMLVLAPLVAFEKRWRRHEIDNAMLKIINGAIQERMK